LRAQVKQLGKHEFLTATTARKREQKMKRNKEEGGQRRPVVAKKVDTQLDSIDPFTKLAEERERGRERYKRRCGRQRR
jgi:hypothetical protein